MLINPTQKNNMTHSLRQSNAKKHIVLQTVFIFFLSLLNAQPVDKVKAWLSQDAASRSAFQNLSLNEPLKKTEAKEITELLIAKENTILRDDLEGQWKNKAIIHDGDTLKFAYKLFGEKPVDGRSFYISMHGGGNAPANVNDQQWKNQIRLYSPAEGIYLAPRAPTNTWNLWHESHIDTLFDLLIHAAVLFENVNRNKVYLMGYSAGGDGVYQLAPRMADYFAAASMMAGHPNETSPLGLRNIGFAIHVGALDSDYNRNEVARNWAVLLDSLQQHDPGGYKHVDQLHAGRAHWMNKEDTAALPWLASFRRNPIPDKIVWKQDDVHHSNFYWIAVPKGTEQTGGEIIISYAANKVTVEKNYSDTLYIHLNDAMMNLDKRIELVYEKSRIFKGNVKRNADIIYKTVNERKDAGLVFPIELMIIKGKLVAINNVVVNK
jgi:hypothetical protein